MISVKCRTQYVLILVLLELTLLLFVGDEIGLQNVYRFNPCFIGTYSFTLFNIVNGDYAYTF